MKKRKENFMNNFNIFINQFNVININSSNHHKEELFDAVKKGNFDRIKEIYKNHISLNSIILHNHSLLHCAVRENQCEIATWLVNQGADPNLVINNQKTPLMLAVKLNRLSFINSLGSHQINHIKEVKGENLLDYGFRKGSIEVFASLIQKTLIFEIPVKSEKTSYKTPIYAIFKEINPKKSEFLHFFKQNYPEKHFIAQNFLHQKTLGHLFEIDGYFLLNSSEAVSFSGMTKSTYFQHLIKKNLFPKLPSDLIKKFENYFEINQTDQEKFNVYQIGKCVTFSTGYIVHEVGGFFWNGFFCICDRSGRSTATVEIYEFDESKLTPQIFRMLRKIKLSDKKNYLNTVFLDLKNKLALKHTKTSNLLREELNLSRQKVGNCAWTDQSGLIEILTGLETAKEDILDPYEKNFPLIKDKIQSGKKTYQKSLHLFKIDRLNKYILINKKDSTYANPTLIAFCLSKIMEEKKELS